MSYNYSKNKPLTSVKYTSRKSPPYHAKDFPGEAKEGNDGRVWQSVKNSRNIYTWKAEKPIVYKSTPAAYYAQFETNKKLHDTKCITSKLPALKKALSKIGITVYYIKWSRKIVEEDPMYDIEYFLEDNDIDDNYILVSEQSIYFSSLSTKGTLYIHHNISSELIKSFNEIFISHFPGRTLGYMNSTSAIKLELVPDKKLKREKDKKEIEINIEFKTNQNTKNHKKYLMVFNRILNKHGYISEYDSLISSTWFILLHVDIDAVKDIVSQIKKLKKVVDYVKSIDINIYK